MLNSDQQKIIDALNRLREKMGHAGSAFDGFGERRAYKQRESESQFKERQAHYEHMYGGRAHGKSFMYTGNNAQIYGEIKNTTIQCATFYADAEEVEYTLI